MEEDRNIEKHKLIWQGITIRVSFERNWLGSPPSDYHPCHLQLESLAPERTPLPMTETGYRSHFVGVEEIDVAGGALAYALAWLDEAAKAKGWKAQVQALRQLSLF